ncbi:hypothetical protein [Peribacillus muralis]|uniref:hypothetical protein n=1 Tax=Peribacillus muralis TaxID=264697 RepID=UPI003CFD4830
MDMQPKVLFTVYRPFARPETYEAILDSTQVVFSGIEVSEYTKVEVQLVCPNDTEAILKIETYETGEILELHHSLKGTTIMGGTNSEHMLVPDKYRFEIITKEKQYVSYYIVSSKDFSEQSLLNLRQYLENLLNGLSYDLVKQKSGMAIPISNMNPTLLQLFQFVNKHKNYIQFNLEMIFKDPMTDLIGEYRVTPHSRRPNRKSFLWQAQKGGQKNSLPNSPRLHLEKHAELTLKNIENQWVRFIIKFFLRSIRKLEVSFQMEANQTSRKMEYQKAQLEQNRRRISLGNNAFGYRKSIEGLKRSEKRLLGRIEELDKERQSYEQHKNLLRQITYLFTQYETVPWFQSVPSNKPKKITQRLLKDYRYRKLYTLYKELSRLETKKVESSLSGIPFRRTWQLFEYYNVGLIIDIFRENDYKWVDGWLASKDSPHQHIGTLPPDTILRFEKSNSDHYIELAYDTEIESAIIDKSYSRYFNDAGRRPDIRITIYRLDGSLYTDKAGLIIESKCRRHKYLINQNIDPDVKLQLKDFKNLEYFDTHASQKGEVPVKTPIKQVIVLYPKQSGMEPVVPDHLYGESMLYLQVEPNDSYSEGKPFGYESLKERIDDFLSQVEESEGVYAE